MTVITLRALSLKNMRPKSLIIKATRVSISRTIRHCDIKAERRKEEKEVKAVM